MARGGEELRTMTDLGRTRLRAAQHVGPLGENLGEIPGLPEGEILRRENGDLVVLTPDGWLVYVNPGKAVSYGRRKRATAELVARIAGE